MAKFDNSLKKKTKVILVIHQLMKLTIIQEKMKCLKAKHQLLTEIKSEMDNYVDPRVSAKAKLMAGEALTEEEANAIVL